MWRHSMKCRRPSARTPIGGRSEAPHDASLAPLFCGFPKPRAKTTIGDRTLPAGATTFVAEAP